MQEQEFSKQSASVDITKDSNPVIKLFFLRLEFSKIVETGFGYPKTIFQSSLSFLGLQSFTTAFAIYPMHLGPKIKSKNLPNNL